MPSPTTTASAPFRFDRDTFSFANELAWEYRIDEATGRMVTRPNRPRPTYTLRCFVLVRACRQFFQHARFDPDLPTLDPDATRARVRQVLGRSPRRTAATQPRVVLPGCRGLREFSREHEALLKRECGAAWRSYFVRGHWRMIFPFSRRHQAHQAVHLGRRLGEAALPILHLVRFPQLTMNHGVLLYDAKPDAAEIRFMVYDPNDCRTPSTLTYHRETRTFSLPRNLYWGGGRVDVLETCYSWLY